MNTCIRVSVSCVFWPPLDFFLKAGSLSNKIAEERYSIIPYSLKQGILPDRSRLKLECLCMCVSRQIPRSSSKDPNPRRPPNSRWIATQHLGGVVMHKVNVRSYLPPPKSGARRVYLQRDGARHPSMYL
jgi:hypothetical protein